ncbi:hypothetical protein DFJ73DRAFT_784454 [Zopfochytrium polystomum]|nr:hypothetical protein DFJ73DRAFT_784454 [Zopfochytrium polystomum]
MPHSRFRHGPAASAAKVLLLLAVACLAGLAVNLVGAGQVDVGGERLTVNTGKLIGEGKSASVYDATDSKGNPAVYKELRPRKKWRDEEIAATKAAGQYISHDFKTMAQKKVGTHGLSEYLDEKKKNPGGWTPNSAEIIRQVDKHQDKVKWAHGDATAGNIRVDTTRTTKSGAPKFKLVDWGYASKQSETSPTTLAQFQKTSHSSIRDECHQRGFLFRPRDSYPGGGVYRRAPGGACAARPPAAGGSGRTQKEQPTGKVAAGAGTRPGAERNGRGAKTAVPAGGSSSSKAAGDTKKPVPAARPATVSSAKQTKSDTPAKKPAAAVAAGPSAAKIGVARKK